MRGRSVPIDQALDALTRAAFFFSRTRLEQAMVLQSAKKQSKPTPRESELIATLTALRALPADVVGEAITKAERELDLLRQRALAQAGLDAVNLQKAVGLLEFLSAWDLEEPTPEGLEELGVLFKTADVVVTTKEHPTLTSNKRPRIVLDQAISGEERVAVVDLPRIGERGCSFEWRDLGAAMRLRK